MTAHHEESPPALGPTEVPSATTAGRSRPPFPWTGLSLVLAVSGLLMVLALPDSHALERQMATEEVERDLHRGLQALRRAVRTYRVDHGAWPGANPDRAAGERNALHASSWLARQLLMPSDAAGRCTTAQLPSHPFGPYLTRGLPRNPINGRVDVRTLAPGETMPAEPDGLSGWIYDPLSGEVRANCDGSLHRGSVRFFDL